MRGSCLFLKVVALLWLPWCEVIDWFMFSWKKSETGAVDSELESETGAVDSELESESGAVESELESETGAGAGVERKGAQAAVEITGAAQ